MTRQEVHLNLKKFNMDWVQDDSVCVFIGRRRTGKSVLVQDLLYHKRDIPYGVCISATEAASPFFQNFIPKTYIYSEFEEGRVQRIIDRQIDIKKRMNRDPGFKPDNRLCLIMDDCLYDNDWSRTKVIRSLFMNGRHYRILYCLTMQYAMGIPPSLRGNIDFSFIMREPQHSNREKLFKQYAAAFPDFGMFCQVMNQLDKFECLVINNNSDSSKLEDQVFWYKADLHESFKFGCENYWNYHYDNYKEEEEGTFDLRNYKGPRSRVLVNVNKKDYE